MAPVTATGRGLAAAYLEISAARLQAAARRLVAGEDAEAGRLLAEAEAAQYQARAAGPLLMTPGGDT